jgi:hypothetical protein
VFDSAGAEADHRVPSQRRQLGLMLPVLRIQSAKASASPAMSRTSSGCPLPPNPGWSGT